MKASNTTDFIKKAKKIHGDKYDYSKVNYINSKTKVEIICPVHGSFFQEANSHLQGEGCPECSKINSGKLRSKSINDFISESKLIHGDKYDYSRVNYINNKIPVTIICPKHGEFNQSPIVHIKGHGCPECARKEVGIRLRKTTEEFIEDSKKIHGDKYDYSKVNYINSHSKVEIICKKHGSFFQKPNSHLFGNGCPTCNESSGERNIRLMLNENLIEYVSQKRFDGFNYPFDFWIPNYNLLIEYQGIIHFQGINFFGGEQEYYNRVKNDICKFNWSEINKISIIYLIYDHIPDIILNPFYQGIYNDTNTFYNLKDLKNHILSL